MSKAMEGYVLGRLPLNPFALEWLEAGVPQRAESLDWILREFETRAKHPLSQDLPENQHPMATALDAYPRVREVVDNWAEIPIIDSQTTTSAIDKSDFGWGRNPNNGWKFHLNVEPADVPVVAKYLSDYDYLSKYLDGYGHATGPGKVFTVYVGSFDKATELAPILSADLQPYLKKPEAIDDAEFARGVVGRFVSGTGRFTYYGPLGIVLMAGDGEHLKELGVAEPFDQQYHYKMAIKAIHRLRVEHGNYFYNPATAVIFY